MNLRTFCTIWNVGLTVKSFPFILSMLWWDVSFHISISLCVPFLKLLYDPHFQPLRLHVHIRLSRRLICCFRSFLCFSSPFPLFSSLRSLPVAVQGDVATGWVASVPSAVCYERCPLLSAMPEGWVCRQVLAEVKSSEWSNDQMARRCHRFLHSVCSDHRLSAADPRSLHWGGGSTAGTGVFFLVNLFQNTEETPFCLRLSIVA